MTLYDDRLAEDSRNDIDLVVMTLDHCQESFGVAPCTGSGTPCFNKFHQCKDKTNFNRGTVDYEFTSAGRVVSFDGAFPCLKRIRCLPTEIKDNLTISARGVVIFYDFLHGDVGMDPYVTQRAAFPNIPGTLGKKLVARNPNFKGRPFEVYAGFHNIPKAQFKQKFKGRIYDMSIGGGEWRVEFEDLLQDLNIEIPGKIDCKLVASVDASAVTMTLDNVDDIDQPSGDTKYLQADDEFIGYTGINATTKQITGCTRGAGGTTAAAHSADTKVSKVRHYGPDNPFDILKEMLLTDAGMAAADVDSTTFDYWRDFLPEADIDFEAWITEDESPKLRALFFEILGFLDAKSWVGEDLKVTMRRNLPNEPGRSYVSISDADNIIRGSIRVDLNDKSRISRINLRWDKTPLGKADEPESYQKVAIGLDYDAEGPNDYGEEKPKDLFCRWLREGLATEEDLARYINNLLARQVWRQRDAAAILSCDVEIRDQDIKTGDWVKVSTDAIQNPDGTSLVNEKFQVVRREKKGNRISLKLIKLHPRRICFIAPDGTPDYDSASEAEKEYGFICSDNLLLPEEGRSYHIY